jgi:anti-anti-sigma regulatory factor
MGNLKVQIHRDQESIVVSFVGAFDITSMPEVEVALERARTIFPDGMRLNLYECEYIDPAGVERLLDFCQELREQRRQVEVYVRPMSFVGYRTKGLPQVNVPPDLAERSEEILVARRLERLRRWRREKPLPTEGARPGPLPAPIEEIQEELIPINFQQVASLAGKDERVVRAVWKTYCRLLEAGTFEPAEDGKAGTQLEMDARKVAFELRLDSAVVHKVIESVNQHLVETFGGEEESR